MDIQYDPPLARCPACRGPRIGFYHQDHLGRRIHRCAACSLLFMNPQYSDAYLEDYYARYIVEEPEWDAPQRDLHHHYFGLIEARASGPGRVLDIGCGRGDLLRVARERGWQATGYDVDPDTVARVGQDLGFELLSGDFLSLPLAARHYDLVTMHHVIEHLKDPLPMLARVRELLRPGGLFFLAQPNIHGFSSRLKYIQEKLGLRRRNMGAYFDADHHVLYFTPRSLTSLLRREGFEVLVRRGAPKVKAGRAGWTYTRRQAFIDRLIPRSAFMIIARKS